MCVGVCVCVSVCVCVCVLGSVRVVCCDEEVADHLILSREEVVIRGFLTRMIYLHYIL